MNSTGSNFNQIVVPSASSKRSHKVQNSQSVGSSQASQRRKNNSQQSNKNAFAVPQQYMPTGSTQNAAELAQLMKKREKLNKSAMDKLNDPLVNQRKFAQPGHPQMFTSKGTDSALNQVNKIYAEKRAVSQL